MTKEGLRVLGVRLLLELGMLAGGVLELRTATIHRALCVYE